MAIHPITDELIEFLNSLAKQDPYALAELLRARVPCNQILAEHPTVQVAAGGELNNGLYIAPGTYRVGMLGILNGFCGAYDDGPRKGWGPIAAVYYGGRLICFERTKNEAESAA